MKNWGPSSIQNQLNQGKTKKLTKDIDLWLYLQLDYGFEYEIKLG